MSCSMGHGKMVGEELKNSRDMGASGIQAGTMSCSTMVGEELKNSRDISASGIQAGTMGCGKIKQALRCWGQVDELAKDEILNRLLSLDGKRGSARSVMKLEA